MQPITRNQLHSLLGEIDDVDAARIISTGATMDELAEALGEVELEDDMGDVAPPPQSSRVPQLRALLEEVLERDDDDDVYD